MKQLIADVDGQNPFRDYVNEAKEELRAAELSQQDEDTLKTLKMELYRSRIMMSGMAKTSFRSSGSWQRSSYRTKKNNVNESDNFFNEQNITTKDDSNIKNKYEHSIRTIIYEL